MCVLFSVCVCVLIPPNFKPVSLKQYDAGCSTVVTVTNVCMCEYNLTFILFGVPWVPDGFVVVVFSIVKEPLSDTKGNVPQVHQVPETCQTTHSSEVNFLYAFEQCSQM